MAYSFGTVAADHKLYRRAKAPTGVPGNTPPCLHNRFTTVDGKHVCHSCAEFDVTPSFFNYVPNENQLAQGAAFHLCSHEPIVVGKPNTNTPLCTTCGACLELANVFNPSDIPLTEAQQLALVPYSAFLLNVERSIHQKFDPDAIRMRKKAAHDPTTGTQGSLTEFEHKVYKLLLKGAIGGCVVVVHDKHEDKYLYRIISKYVSLRLLGDSSSCCFVFF